MEEKDNGSIKIISKEQAFWEKAVEQTTKEIEALESALKINRVILEASQSKLDECKGV